MSNFQDFDDLPINWSDHEDIAMKLYERFGEEFTAVSYTHLDVYKRQSKRCHFAE